MKPMLLATALMFATHTLAQQAITAPTLLPGGEVKPDALTKGEWIQGAGPAAWEPGKVYMLECWATWCGPCVAVIPHVNELHKKYSEKGLRVVGVNVWEDGKEKVEAFVKAKGDGMSYPVVYTGKGSDFEKEWLNAAAVRGIPHAFLVRDGKLLLKSHPSRITDEVILAALEGGAALDKITESMNKAEAEQSALMSAMREFSMASSKKDVPAMEAAFAKLKEADKSGRYLAASEAALVIAKKDWDAVAKLLEKGGEDKMLVFSVVRAVSGDEEVPAPLLENITTKFVALTKDNAGPIEWQTISRLQWKMGKKDDALGSARSVLEKAKEAKTKNANFPLAPFEKFAAAVEEGKMPSEAEVRGWLQESMPKRAMPAAPKAATDI
ncbi:MAG: TlpA disulfide reductase family protein [Verrucomicrobiales bacterium]